MSNLSRTNDRAERSLYRLLSDHRNALMGFAALWIVIFHTWTPLFSYVPVLGAAERFVVRYGFYGVEIFLFLSGLGMVFSIEKHTVGGFYHNRFGKLLLPYAAVAVVRAVVERWTAKEAAMLLSGYAFIFKNAYSFLWYVQTIAVYYLLFPLYYAGMRRSRRPIAYTLAALGVWLTLTLLATSPAFDNLKVFTNRIPVFLIGVLFGELAKRDRLPSCKKLLPCAAVLFAAGLFTCFVDFFYGVPASLKILASPVANILTALPLCLFLSLLFDRLPRGLSFVARFFGFLGTISLELYCVQDLYARNILIGWLRGLPAPVYNVAVLLWTIAISWPAHWLFTKAWNAINKRRAAKNAGKA